MGNSKIKESLQSMLKRKHEDIPHAFLFTGLPGMGKTTLARILAKELGAKGIDIHELNAADFRGIDTIREEIKHTYYQPMSGKCKAYIWDEAGQLTEEAQAGYLKILEEPPSHVYIMLCTNEPEKLRKDLMSRCVKYHLNPLTERQLVGILDDVCDKEGKSFDHEHMKLIANISNGSPREALSKLDQVIDLEPDSIAKALKDKPNSQIKFHTTPLGNAERFVFEHGKDICFCYEKKFWYTWDGTRWITQGKDTGKLIFQKAKQTIRNIYTESQLTHDKNLEKWWKSSDNSTMINGIIKTAVNENVVSISEKDLDANIWLLNCKNGTLNLKTGELQTHNREDYITRIIPYDYDPDAECPTWEKFIDFVTEGLTRKKRFLQRIVGYTLTGDVSGKCLFFLYGPPNTGKTTFLETIRVLMGDYAKQSEFRTFISSSKGKAIRNDIARLEKARFVSASEAGEGEKFDLPVLKLVSGGDTIVARYLYNEFFEFKPEFKIWLASNHFPKVQGGDDAAWDRIYPLVFNKQVDNKDRDGNLRKKFELEMPGILNWAIKGSQSCYDEDDNLKLRPPAEITQAKKILREEVDLLLAFISECCEVKKDGFTKFSDLFDAWCKWCEKNHFEPGTDNNFSRLIHDRGYPTKSQFIQGKTHRLIIGLNLRT